MRVVVIGAGSIGANIAYRSRQEGADVVVVDAGRPGGGTTGASISWLSNFPQVGMPEESGRLGMRAKTNQHFVELAEEIGGAWVHWTGTLTWGGDGETRAALRTAMRAAGDLGFHVELLDAPRVAELEPGLRLAPDDEVFFEPDGGWVDAPAMVSALLDRLVDLGGRVMPTTPVVALRSRGDRVDGVVTAGGETIEADVVVNAAGSWGTHVAAMAGVAIPLHLYPGLVVYSRVLAGDAIRHVWNTPTLSVRPDPGGGVAIHWRGEGLFPTHRFNARSAQEVIDTLAGWLPAIARTEPAASRVGIRAVPPGGPIIGAAPGVEGLYLAISHGGVGWGPTWGRLVPREILGGERVKELSDMRPDRFFASPSEMPIGPPA